MSEEKKEETLEQEKKEVLDQEKELDTNELDEVAGGSWCSCCFGGGGSPDAEEDEKTCACIAAGAGEWDREHHGKTVRCACAVAGWGEGYD